MRKILAGISLVGLVLVIANFSGGLAYFSDVVASEGNRLQAGQLEIIGEDINDVIPFDEECIEPGDSGEGSLTLHVSDNPAWVLLDLEKVSGVGVLSEELVFTVELEGVHQWTGTASEFPVSIELGDEPFENCTDYELTVRWDFDDDAEVYQKENLEFDMIFTAYQSRHHPQDADTFESGFHSVLKIEGNEFTTGCWIECETAWAYGGDYAENLSDYVTAERWGWTNGPLDNDENYTFELWAGAGRNDLNKGTLVGSLYVEYIDGVWRVTYRIDAGFAMREAHLWVGEDVLPNGDGGYTAAPGQFPYKEEGISTEYTFEVTDLPSDGIYVAAHAVVCGDFSDGGNPNRSDSTEDTLEEEPKPAEFEVTDLEVTPENVDPGETVEVSALVVNSGEEAGECVVEFFVEDNFESSRDIELDGGENERVEFLTSREGEDEHEVSISTPDDSETCSFTVENFSEDGSSEKEDEEGVVGGEEEQEDGGDSDEEDSEDGEFGDSDGEDEAENGEEEPGEDEDSEEDEADKDGRGEDEGSGG